MCRSKINCIVCCLVSPNANTWGIMHLNFSKNIFQISFARNNDDYTSTLYRHDHSRLQTVSCIKQYDSNCSEGVQI